MSNEELSDDVAAFIGHREIIHSLSLGGWSLGMLGAGLSIGATIGATWWLYGLALILLVGGVLLFGLRWREKQRFERAGENDE